MLTGGDDGEGGAASGSNGSRSQAAGGQAATIPGQRQGQAIIAEQGGKTQIIVTATGLDPSTPRTAYQVWLYNSEQDRKSLGATVTDQQGSLQSGTQLPADYRKYSFIDVTSVSVQGSNRQSFQTGPSVLRGLLELRAKPVIRGKGEQKISVLADIRLRPLPTGG